MSRQNLKKTASIQFNCRKSMPKMQKKRKADSVNRCENIKQTRFQTKHLQLFSGAKTQEKYTELTP